VTTLHSRFCAQPKITILKIGLIGNTEGGIDVFDLKADFEN
jgi:hypothetical protein